MDEITNIIADIRAGNIKPIYFLMGEEPYYIDRLTEFLEDSILTEDEKGFNQMVLYGRDISVDDIVANAKRYPMMADRQVVIVKEAQELSRTIEQLDAYAKNPQPTTVLVIAYKYKTIDKRKSLYKSVDKIGLVFESKKMYEDKIATWVVRILKTKGYGIEPKAAQILVEFLGNDLSRIHNELTKLQIILPSGTTITPQHIEENIGFSKDFNVFELRKSIGERNVVKAYTIAQHFANNPKDNPMVLTTGMVFSFFSQLLQYHGLKDKSAGNAAKVLKINPYFIKDYDVALKNYPMKKVSNIVATLRSIDAKSKGVGANQINDGDLLKEMLVNIFA